MKINKYHGIFYDTLFYMLVHFYRDTLIDRVFNRSEDIAYDMRFHDVVTKKLDEKNIVIPDDIKILFYTNIDRAAYIANVYRKKINFYEADYNDFYNIYTNKELIKKEFFEYYFAVESEDLKVLIECSDLKRINQIIKKSDLPNEVKPDFYMFSVAANENISIFIETFKTILPIIESIHEENADVYYNILNKLKDNNIYIKLIQSFKKEEDRLLILSISLMNPIGIFFTNNKDSNYFMLGESFNINFSMQNNKSGVYSVMRVLGTKQRQDIFDLFIEYEKLSKNDIAEIMHISYHAVQSYIDIFHFEKIITLSNKRGNENYYMLNNKYFENYKNLIIDYYDKVLLNNYGRKDIYERKNNKKSKNKNILDKT